MLEDTVAASDVGLPTTGSVAGRHASTIAPMSSLPEPATRPAREAVGRALPTTAARSSAGVSDGLMEAHRAMAPETWGVAIEVPLSDAYPLTG